jgi:hypothetical protein
MLSYVLYGRNDSYGYNLHKRAALSLNCMAEMLSDDDDEILFVDYNTPDDFPTFPEAIQDTLTDKAKRHLRIFRVRPSMHARFANKTHLLALEPVSRNVALRRSNPANRWILSTNTDMIFVPRRGRSMSDIVRDLPAGHYGIPRFELPETLWESLDRGDPQNVIAAIGRWGWQLHLNHIVYGMRPFLFDGPGDFQLIARDDLFKFHGFHEAMLVGWHVDANIAKRISLVHGDVGDLSSEVFGYHCDHTRQVTPAHRRNSVENSFEKFFAEVDRPDVPEQAESWGLADEKVEEIRLSASTRDLYVRGLEAALPVPLERPLVNHYIPETYDRGAYSPEHVLPFLLDLFASAPRHWSVAWIGAPDRLFELFAQGWQSLGFNGKVLLPDGAFDIGTMARWTSYPSVQKATPEMVVEAADAFIFDFAGSNGRPLTPKSNPADAKSMQVFSIWLNVLGEVEQLRRGRGLPLRRMIGVNAIHNRFDRMFKALINVGKTPFGIGIRHGYFDLGPGSIFAVDRDVEANWLGKMLTSVAGERSGDVIRSRIGVSGYVAYGPYNHLPPGRYVARIALRSNTAEIASPPSASVLGLLSKAIVIGWLRGLKGRGLGRILRNAIGEQRTRQLARTVSHTVASLPENGIVMDIVADSRCLAVRQLAVSQFRSGTYELTFDVKAGMFGTSATSAHEARLWSNGQADITIEQVTVRCIHKEAAAGLAARLLVLAEKENTVDA